MSDDPIITVDAMARWWGQPPEIGVGEAPERLGAAVWSGEPREIFATSDPKTAVVATPLSTYQCEVMVDGKVVSNRLWRPGEIQIMTPGVAPRAVLGTPWRMLHVYLPVSLIEAAAAARNGPRDVALIDPLARPDAALSKIMASIARELESGSAPSRLMIDAYGQILSDHLVRHWSSAASAPRSAAVARGGLAPLQLKRVRDYCAARLAEDVTLVELASVANLSPYHFLRAFKHTTGATPHAFLIEKRMQRAQELMRALPAMGLAEIALSVGYESQPAFTTAFKRVTGATPARWRREVVG